jgi:hypothetical protein
MHRTGAVGRRSGPLKLALRRGWLRHMALDHMHADHSTLPQTSSYERHQGGPRRNQTKSHSSSSKVSAHRRISVARRMAMAHAPRCDPEHNVW